VEEGLFFVFAVFTIAVVVAVLFFFSEKFVYHFENQQIVAAQTYKDSPNSAEKGTERF
jgi:hypothetical protein